jgi:GxxExxY protein
MAEDQKDPKTYAIIGAAMEVHRQLGHGFLEAVYQEALTIELGLRDVPTRPQVELPVRYKDHELKTSYEADFVCYESIIAEIKAVSDLLPAHEAQLINYLRATGLSLGLLINFGTSRLEYRRLDFSSRPGRRDQQTALDAD